MYKAISPILLLVFRRLETTKLVFEEIKKSKPNKLYIACDGARDNNIGEMNKVSEVRKYLLDNIDWECNIQTLFRDKNLGCKLGVSTAIDWFFEHEEMGIILEDDILPSQDFFRYCDELLVKYKNNERIMHIAGMTYAEKQNNEEHHSYHFARVGGIWGWASWRRAWKLYELEMESYPQAKKENIFDDLFIGEDKIKNFYINNMFELAYKNTYTWDYQWTYTKIINNSINIMPSKNLVKNIGFATEGATHTTTNNDKYESMKIKTLDFPLTHPKFVAIDKEFDHLNFDFHF